jgi:hypothetical protein
VKQIILAALMVPAIAFAQVYPSPTFNSLALQNPLTAINGGTGTTSSTGTGSVVLSNGGTLTAPTISSPTITGSIVAASGSFTALSASTTNPSFSYTSSGTGATSRTYGSKFGDLVNVRDFGSSTTCNGSGNDGAAFTGALAVSSTIRVSAGSACVISSSLTLPKGTELYIDAGAVISVSSGATLTIRGSVHAPLTNVFQGLGTVTGIAEVWPEWWGATGTGVAHNDAPAIQAAENSMEGAQNLSDGSRVLHLRPVSYGVGATIAITPQATAKISWVGTGSSGGQTNFLGLSAFTGIPVIQVFGSAPAATDFELKGFSITPQTAGAGPSQGIRFGSSAGLIGGKIPPLISDIYVADFTQDISIQDVDLLLFLNVAGWCNTLTTCTPLSITNGTASNSFTGDLTFLSGQFVAPAGTLTQASISVTTSTNGGRISGIRFVGSTAYYGGIVITATNSGVINDTWFESGFQLDVTTNYGLNWGSGSGGTIADIHFDNSYLYGASGNTTPLVNLFSSFGTTRDIFINGNSFDGYSNAAPPFVISGVNQVNFSGNKLINLTYSGGALFNVSSSFRFQINENAVSDSTYGYFITVATGQDYYTVRSNLCGGQFTIACVNNAAAGPHSTVDGNW